MAEDLQDPNPVADDDDDTGDHSHQPHHHEHSALAEDDRVWDAAAWARMLDHGPLTPAGRRAMAHVQRVAVETMQQFPVEQQNTAESLFAVAETLRERGRLLARTAGQLRALAMANWTPEMDGIQPT